MDKWAKCEMLKIIMIAILSIISGYSYHIEWSLDL